MSEKEPLGSNTGLSDISFVKTISLGSIDSNTILTDEEKEQQVSLLNRMLSDFPKGRIIGKDITLAETQAGDQQITLQKQPTISALKGSQIGCVKNKQPGVIASGCCFI